MGAFLKILTLGPASQGHDVLLTFLHAADAFRLNVAHLSPAATTAWLERLQEVFAEAGRVIPVVLDLQGAKMRIGEIERVDALPERVVLVHGDRSEAPTEIPVPHAELFESVKPGETLLLNDSRVCLRVLENRGGTVSAETVRNGPLSSHKGINRAMHPLPFRDLTPGDRSAVQAGLAFPFVQFALSFVLQASDATIARRYVGERPLVAKIERPEAFANLDEIAQAFSALWLCRGDLGAQAGLRALGPLQRDFTARIGEFGKPAFLAGQVLEHMTSHPEPTRAEVVGLYEAVQSGFQGIVLSDETAVGRNPLEVVRFLSEFLPL